MTGSVTIEQAQRLREAETRWLRQSADRLRAAHARPAAARAERQEDES